MKFKSDIEVQAGLKDSSGAAGTSGQVLSTTVTGVSWVNPDGFGYVPYTGATANVDLGNYSLSAYDLIINHSSGSGVAASITKGGNGEALTVVKSSGTGNAASITGGTTLISELHLTTDLADDYIASAATWNAKQSALNGTGFVKISGSTISYDNSTYVPTSRTLTINGTAYDLSADRSWTISAGVTGTGTTNYIPKFTGTSAIGNSLIYDNGTNVGIGTTSPDSKLHVTGNIKVGNALDNSSQWIGKSSTGTENFRGAIKFTSTTTDDIIQFNTHRSGVSSDIRMTIDGIGNVGIGTTSPSGQLDVYTNNYKNFNVSYPSTYETRLSFGTAAFAAYDAGSATLSLFATDATYGAVSLGAGNTERMRITSGGHLLVGTTTSLYGNSTRGNIELNGSASSLLALKINDAIGCYLYTSNVNSELYSTLPLTFAVNGSERMRITSGGNVGIGTTTDAGYKLDVNGTGRFTGVTTFNGGNIDGTLGEAILFGNASYPNSQKNRIRSSISAGVLSNLLALEAGDGTIGGYYNNQLVLRGDGNVGIGVASPRTKLDVEAYTSFMSLSSGINSEATTADQQIGGIDFRKHYALAIGASIRLLQAGGIYNYSQGHLAFYTNDGSTAFGSVPPEKMRITSNGNILVNTQTDAGHKLDVNGKIRSSGGMTIPSTQMYDLTDPNHGMIYNSGVDGPMFRGYGGFTWNTGSAGATPRMYLTPAAGLIVVGLNVTATGFFNSSDNRLKELTDYDYNVSDIKPISYLWKDSRDNKKHVGYSAQEVQKVMPDAVNEGEDGMLSVNYIEVLVAKIAELENRIKQLEK